MLRVLVELRPKLLRQKSLLAPRLDEKRQPHRRHRNQAAHLPAHNRIPEKPKQNPRVNRMPYVSIRPRPDEFVIFLQGHNSAPVRTQMHARPARESQPDYHQRHARPLHFWRMRHEIDSQPFEMEFWIVEHIKNGNQWQEVPQPRTDRSALFSLL